jgi:phage tail tape-measure protein
METLPAATATWSTTLGEWGAAAGANAGSMAGASIGTTAAGVPGAVVGMTILTPVGEKIGRAVGQATGSAVDKVVTVLGNEPDAGKSMDRQKKIARFVKSFDYCHMSFCLFSVCN